MWFKNISAYVFAEGFDLDVERLQQALTDHRFRACARSEQSRLGWVNPVDSRNVESDQFVHQLGAYAMVCLRKEEKLLPAAVVNDVVEEQVREIEARDARKVYRKEKLQLKDEAIATLLPRAFSRHRVIHAYVSLKDRMLIVNTASASQAEELIGGLRDALGSFPVRRLSVQHSPMALMTQWLKDGQCSNGFVMDQDCELVNPMEDGNVIRCKSQDLGADEITAHLDANKQVRKLGVLWNDAVACVVTADLLISRVRFEDMVLEKAREAEAELAAEQFDQDFAVMSLVISDLLAAVIDAFGGLAEV